MDILAKITEAEFTTKGSIPIGFLYASIKNVGTREAKVGGVKLASGEAKGYPFVGKGYQSVDFEPESSTLRVLYIQ